MEEYFAKLKAMQDLCSVIEKLPPDLQTKVYDYALTLARETKPDELVLNLHKGSLGKCPGR